VRPGQDRVCAAVGAGQWGRLAGRDAQGHPSWLKLVRTFAAVGYGLEGLAQVVRGSAAVMVCRPGGISMVPW
jgi:hypothetical protein